VKAVRNTKPQYLRVVKQNYKVYSPVRNTKPTKASKYRDYESKTLKSSPQYLRVVKQN
jgi:hypothetical protein